ncbi:TPA: arsenite methyltransferase [Candidatus Poribacteria bacterium]|nr:arsenite methyltransferase [Candidatus Poribacteria bacterium]
MSETEIKKAVREHYAALVANKEGSESCCARDNCCESSEMEEALEGNFAKLGYTEEQISQIPLDAVENSFGCGNPLALAEINEGDVVLDLGSGAGIDVLLAAKRVGPKGKAIGLDMTPQMIEKARQNAAKMGADNVEFRLGEMEAMPIENNSVSLIISNCVINLSPDKDKVFSEAFRVLKPGGKMMVSDIVAKNLPRAIKSDMESWAGCIAGALEEEEYLEKIRRAGFADVAIVDRAKSDLDIFGDSCCDLSDALGEEDMAEVAATLNKIEIASIKVSATKPDVG